METLPGSGRVNRNECTLMYYVYVKQKSSRTINIYFISFDIVLTQINDCKSWKIYFNFFRVEERQSELVMFLGYSFNEH